MGGPEHDGGEGGTAPAAPAPVQAQHYGRYVGLLALVILVLITVNTILTKPNGLGGVPPGSQLPAFAVPLVLGNLQGDADVATRPNEGEAGKVPACQLRGPQILNVCALYEHAPLVLALFVDGGSCPQVLSDMEALAPSYPGVSFAAVAIRGSRSDLRGLVRSRGLTYPVGLDEEGTLASLYKLASCPQVNFAYPGGVVYSRPLLGRPAPAVLRARVSELVAAARSRGWRGPA